MAFDPDVYIGPFHELLGLEIEHATDGTAVVTLDLERKHSSPHQAMVAQEGVVSTLADFCGGIALASLAESPSALPTLDLRIDYLRPATTDLRAEGETLWYSGQSGVARVEIYDVDDHRM